MAFKFRLFQNRKNAKQYTGLCHSQEESSNGNQPRPKLDKSRIRLLIIADTEKGRVPYFDSNAIHRSEDQQNVQHKIFCKTKLAPACGTKNAKDTIEQPGFAGKNGVKYQFQKIGSDVKLLEEMMFGAVAMAFKGSTLKVHHIRFPPQLVVTKVFFPQKPKPDSTSGDGDSDSAPSSLSSSYADHMNEFLPSVRKARASDGMTIPVDVPLVRENLADSTDEDSGLYSLTSSGSFQSLFPSPSNNSASSYNSLHRRWMRSQTTSLQRKWDSQETLNSMETSQMPKKRQVKLAIGILYSTSEGKHSSHDKDTEEYKLFQSFFFAHMALIEGHVEGLRGSVERAVFAGRNMVPMIFEALDKFRDAMFDLYMAPRLREPVWLSMMSNISYRYVLCERFVNEFMSLVSKYDNKSTKFFVSTLLSAVLTYHLAWVATVTPGDGTHSQTYLDKHSAKWIDTLAKTHPYNPLWAQLGDLYGAIGNPVRVARTVVVGKKGELVNKLLYVLSYFIRCSDLHQAAFPHCLASLLDRQPPHSPPPRSVASLDANLPAPGDPILLSPRSSVMESSGSTVCGSCGSFTNVQSGSDKRESPGVAGEERSVWTDVGDREVRRTDVECEECRTPTNSVSKLQCHCHAAPSLQHITDLRTEDSVSHTKGDDTAVNNVNTCKIAAVHIVEQSRQENVRHVQKSVVVTPSSVGEEVGSPPYSKRLTSLLSQQLAADSEASSALDKQKLKREAQKLFLSGGKISDSNFDEYFEGDAETKTIDDVSEHQRVVRHPLARPGTSSPSPSALSGGQGSEDGSQVKGGVSRQSSVDVKLHVARPTALNPARTRSVTPTELERRRHLSSTSSLDLDAFDPLVHCQEIPIPTTCSQLEQVGMQPHENFGRSLLGGYSDHYLSDFVLHGTSDVDFKAKLVSDLQTMQQHSILDEPVSESVCIIADTDNWTVEVVNSRLLEMSPKGSMPWTPAHTVSSLIDSLLQLHQLKMSAEFCIMHLEDRMQEIYFKSVMLAEYLKTTRASQRNLTAMLGLDASDLPLLLSVAGTHTPNLATGSEARNRSSFH